MTDRVDEVVNTLRLALQVLDKAAIPTDLRPAALPIAIDLLTTRSGTEPGEPANETSDDSRSERANAGVRSGPPGLERLAQRVGVPVEQLADIYYVEDNDLELTVPSRKIAREKKEGAVEVAVLVAVGRQGTGIDEEWTNVGERRKWVQQLDRYNEGHFGEHIETADKVLTLLGKGRQRKVRVKWNERDQLRDIILRVAGRE